MKTYRLWQYIDVELEDDKEPGEDEVQALAGSIEYGPTVEGAVFLGENVEPYTVKFAPVLDALSASCYLADKGLFPSLKKSSGGEAISSADKGEISSEDV